MVTLTDDLEPVKDLVAKGELELAAALVAGYGALKPGLARRAKGRMPAMIFNQHPRFRALGARQSAWPESERKDRADAIERNADAPKRLPSIVDQAAAAAEAALKAV